MSDLLRFGKSPTSRQEKVPRDLPRAGPLREVDRVAPHFSVAQEIQHRPGGSGPPPSTPPVPATVVDAALVERLARTSQLPLIERRAENKRFHHKAARRVYRDVVRGTRAGITSLTLELSQLTPNLKRIKKAKASLIRFLGQNRTGEGKRPASGWEYTKFYALLLMLILAVANGTLTVGNVMLKTPAFEGSVVKAVSAGLGLFLMPSLGFYFPFFLLSDRKGVARIYLLCLASAGVGFFCVFGLSWSYLYAVDTGNELLLDLASIGTSEDGKVKESPFWLFRNAGWISLFCNILGDAAFAGCAKAGMTLLAQRYTLFRRHALQQSPEWQLLDQEELETVQQMASLEAEKTRLEAHLDEVKEESSDFGSSVVSLADMLLLEDVDRQESRRLELKALQNDLDAREKAFSKKREQLHRFLFDNPGVQTGGHDDETS